LGGIVYAAVTYHATLVLLTACFLGSSNDVRRDDATMRGRDSALLHLARHAFLDQVPEPEAHLCNFDRRDGRVYLLIVQMRQHWSKRAKDVC
jgi:hypothetical protein